MYFSYKRHQEIRKPCFVPLYSSGSRLVRRVVIIYLQTIVCPFLRSVPSEERPYHNLGFSLVGFTAFHLLRFRSSYVTVALFRKSLPYSKELRNYFRRQLAEPAPRLIFWPSTNTTDISVPCEHGLSSPVSSTAAIT